ncbi:MAG: hypothetical protein WBA88_18440 [Pseudaminobacter sp.]
MHNARYAVSASNIAPLGDAGAGFLHQVQAKAEFNSTFWTAGAALIAAFGGGKLSVDRYPSEQGRGILGAARGNVG